MIKSQLLWVCQLLIQQIMVPSIGQKTVLVRSTTGTLSAPVTWLAPIPGSISFLETILDVSKLCQTQLSSFQNICQGSSNPGWWNIMNNYLHLLWWNCWKLIIMSNWWCHIFALFFLPGFVQPKMVGVEMVKVASHVIHLSFMVIGNAHYMFFSFWTSFLHKKKSIW